MESRLHDVEQILKVKDDNHTKAMAEVLENATTNYAVLEKKHHKIINLIKDAKEKARTEAELKAKMEAEVVELKEKVRLLEAECIKSIGLAWEEGKQAGQQELMDQVRTDFQGVFNRGFRDGCKSALKKAKVPRFSRWFLKDKTPLPYPEVGLRDSDAKDEDDEDENEEVGGEQGTGPSTPVPEDPPAPPEGVTDPPVPL